MQKSWDNIIPDAKSKKFQLHLEVTFVWSVLSVVVM